MKTKTINLYEYSELSYKAKEKALSDYNANNDYPFLTDDLREYIHEELKDKGFTVNGIATSENPTIRPLYSLSYCQGDGLCFEASLSDKEGNTYTIKHRGNYYHARSVDITVEDKEGNEIDAEKFTNDIYIPICKTVERRGYDIIKYEDSEENFIEMCEANGYTFEESGKMNNI